MKLQLYCIGGLMNNLNSTIVEGNAVRKPELRTSPKGTSICILPVAVNRYYKNASGTYDEEVSFFDVESYGKLAEFCASATDKGQGVRVKGRLKQARWKSPEGKNISKVYIVAERIELKPLKKSGGVPNCAENLDIEPAAEEDIPVEEYNSVEEQAIEEQTIETRQAIAVEA